MTTKKHIIYLVCLLVICSLVIHSGNAYAQSTWALVYGGVVDDYAQSIEQTSDGGYIVAGYTTSFGTGNSDMWVLKFRCIWKCYLAK